MHKFIYWGAGALIVLLIGVAIWWSASAMEDRKNPLNKPDAFVYSEKGGLYWFELTSQRGKVKGQLHEQKIIELGGNAPIIKEKKYPLTGKKTEKGYVFKVKDGRKIITYNVRLSGVNLSVQKQGDKGAKLYKAASKKALNEDVKALQNELQIALNKLEEMEQKENERIDKFFTELNRVYGYLYTAEDNSFQVFMKFEEAVREGDFSGYFLVMTHHKNKPYEETKYKVTGITDGNMIEAFTTVKGIEAKLKGHFHGSVKNFDLSFWTTEKQLVFHAVTEDEFTQRYQAFKAKAQR
ncbi:hypothetical protein ACFO4N_17025 [Camelliibacillus cellulosilyticus]|uniref:Uncharacterized protein n=1 Tax=Camelliibacillus cellulosilyticus TaxID=2174486 RepID=A0ABV9GUU8_9BACL